MNFQELKTKINDWFESKSAAERQKMKKYLLVIPGAAIIFLGSMWLIFGSYMSDDSAEKGKANMELPDGDSDKLQGNKLKALAEAEMQKEKARQDSILSAASVRQDSVPADTMAAPEPSRLNSRPCSIRRYRLRLMTSSYRKTPMPSAWRKCRNGLTSWRRRTLWRRNRRNSRTRWNFLNALTSLRRIIHG